ncbi:MAG: hypothetical protein V1807_01050 [Patescibacteria group bacterium]
MSYWQYALLVMATNIFVVWPIYTLFCWLFSASMSYLNTRSIRFVRPTAKEIFLGREWHHPWEVAKSPAAILTGFCTIIMLLVRVPPPV